MPYSEASGPAGLGTAILDIYYSKRNEFQQSVINGGFDVWQRGSTFTPNNDTYIADRWNCLQEANSAWTFSKETAVPVTNSGAGPAARIPYALKALNVTLNKQCGIVQILESQESLKFAGKNVSLSFYAQTTASHVISNLRATVLSWTGTADAVTSNVVGTWNSDGTDPSWAANWTSEIVGINLPLAQDAYTLCKIENIALDTGSLNNIAIVIWVDDGTIAANDAFWVTGVQINIGSKALPYQPKTFNDELLACLRYYEKSFEYGTAPADNAGTFVGAYYTGGFSDAGSNVYMTFTFKVPKRNNAVTMTSYNRGAGTAGQWEYSRVGSNSTSAVNFDDTGEMSFTAHVGVGLGGVIAQVIGQWTADAEL